MAYTIVIFQLICYICLVKMQLNDVIKSISWYRYQALVVLLIQTDITKNSIDANIGIGIGPSLAIAIFIYLIQ